MLQTYKLFVEAHGDPRTRDWAFVSSPLPTIGLVLLYLLFVKKIGPAFMRDRKAYDLRGLMIGYNLFQTVASGWMFYQGSVNGWMSNYSLTCQLSDYKHSPQALRVSFISWLFFLSKFLDFTDTIIFVLRKKNEQISQLHLVHHSTVPILCWIGVMFHPEGHYTFAGYLNSFVHTVMYGYYLIAAMGPSLRPYLWWKKYLTTLQLVQFVIVMIHTGQTVLNFQCDIPKTFTLVIGFQAVMFYFLFMSFFKKSYVTNKSNPKIEEKTTAPSGIIAHSNGTTTNSPQKDMTSFTQTAHLRNITKQQNQTQNSYSLS